MTEQKTGIRPKVGDSVWIVSGNKSESRIVGKVGKKYFYLEKPYEHARDIRFEIGCKNGATDGTDWNPTQVYESESVHKSELDNCAAIDELRTATMQGHGWFTYKRPDNVTASDIMRAIAILKGEVQ
jgi:hypothetical protein